MSDIPRRLKQLEKQLASLDGDEAMLLTELDGFLAGILVCPDLIMPGEWLPMVWGGGKEDATAVFENTKQVEQLVGLIMERYNAVAADLQRGLPCVGKALSRQNEKDGTRSVIRPKQCIG